MDTTVLQFLAAPFAASLILTGIHAYLGVHVVERGVIFVDLSLAQIAALGATMARADAVHRRRPAPPRCLLGEPRVHVHRRRRVLARCTASKARIPQEAIIGICYAVASAASIVAMSKSASQAEHLQHMLVGNILAVSWPEVVKTAALYGAIGRLPLRLPATSSC